VDKRRAKRMAKAGIGAGAFLVLLGAVITGLQGPNWLPVMAFGLAVLLCALAFLAFLLIRQRMILRNPGIREYEDWFGSARVGEPNSSRTEDPLVPSSPAVPEETRPRASLWERLRQWLFGG
jgi:hypothetical protein